MVAQRQRDELTAIVVLTVVIGLAAFAARRFEIPELYAVVALLTFYLGSRTKPGPRRLERSLRSLPSNEVDSIYERVTGRPPQKHESPSPVRFENG